MPKRFKARLKIPREAPTLLLLIAASAALAHYTPAFGKVANLTTLGKDAAIFGIIACGEGVVILSGGLDLSVASVLALSSCAAASALAAHWSILAAMAAGLAAAAICGLLNGALITYRKLPPILTTLATLLMFRYGASIGTHARNFGDFPDRFNQIGADWHPTFLFIGIAAIFILVSTRTRFGRWIFAMGGSEQSARLSGIPVDRVKRAAYLISALCAGVGGLIAMAFNNTTQSTVAQGLELNVIAACVVGGIRITGGDGSILGAALGAFLIALVPDALVLTQRPAEQYGLVTGAVILIAAVVEQQRSQRKQVHVIASGDAGSNGGSGAPPSGNASIPDPAPAE